MCIFGNLYICKFVTQKYQVVAATYNVIVLPDYDLWCICVCVFAGHPQDLKVFANDSCCRLYLRFRLQQRALLCSETMLLMVC